MKNYFVMCFHPAKSITAIPMIENEDGDIAFFETEEEARDIARHNDFADAYGYEIFCMGEGEL